MTFTCYPYNYNYNLVILNIDSLVFVTKSHSAATEGRDDGFERETDKRKKNKVSCCMSTPSQTATPYKGSLVTSVNLLRLLVYFQHLV